MDTHTVKPLELLIVRHSRSGFAFNFELNNQLQSALHAHFSTILFSEIAETQALQVNPHQYDAVLVFGGAMFVHETQKYPWLVHEMKFIETVLKAGIPLVGICLGGQLLAHVLGARVYKIDKPEFGYHAISLTPEGQKSSIFKGFEHTFTAFEWHYEGFDIPHGAVKLAESLFWPHQAFAWGANAFGFQFHLEFTYDHLAYMLRNDKSEVPQESVAARSITETLQDQISADAVARTMGQLVQNIGELAALAHHERTK